MSMEIRLPNITASREAEQISQIKSYLIQLVDQLNWALETMEKAISDAGAAGEQPAAGGISEEMFGELKSVLVNKYVTRAEFDELRGIVGELQKTGGE